MKIVTNKTLGSFLNRLSAEPVSLAKKIEKIDIVIQFTSWLVDSKQLSPNDGIRFRNELYKKKREFTPKEAPKQAFPLNYVGFSLAALSLLLVLGGIYIRFFRDTKTPFAYSTAPVQAGRNISFQGRLTDSLGNPISAPIDISYSFYTVSSGGSPISSSTRVCTASPDQDGVFSTLIGKDAGGTGGTLCNVEIPNSVFTENTDVYLGVTVGGGSEMTPRQQIANVGYAINSETLQGMPPGQSVSNIPFINQSGDMLIAAANPGLRSTFASSTFTISSGLATTIQSGTGDITLTATNGGSLRFRTYSSPGNTLERLTIMPTTGRVGVGTAAPRALFDVAGDATVSGSLIAGGQIKIGEFTVPPTNLGNGSTYYDSNTNKIYYWNGTAWTDLASSSGQYWQRTLGSVAPTNITDDVNTGAVATGSAMVHLPGLVNKDAWFNLGTGKVGVGDVTPLSLFTVGNGDLFQVNSAGRIVALDGVAHTIDDVSGNLTLTSNSSTISLNDNVTFAGTTTLNSQAYTWPGAITNAYILQTNGTGTLSWVDPIGLVGGANLWSLANGTLYPVNTTLDMFVGGTATTSAKFAFINSNSGTPTASISGTTANVRTFVDGNGNISTTNRTSLTLGNSATYNSTGNILLNPNGTGNVGIGLTSPAQALDVGGNVQWGLSGNNGVLGWATGWATVRGNTGEGLSLGSNNTIDKLVIDTTGNIGVGTTTPTAKLDVVGDASLSGHLVLRGTTPNYIHVMNGTDLRISNSPGGDVGNVDRLTMLNNGSFGFGTTNPTAKIDVRTASGNTGAGIKVGQYTVNGAAGQTLFPTGGTWYEYPGIVGVGSGTTTLDIPSLDNYGTVGVVGVGGSSTGGRSNVGIYGHAYFDAAMGGNTGNLLYGGKFTTRITANANDYKGTSYGLYSKADTTGGTSTAGSVYGLYSQALGQTNNTTYGGYFTGSGGTTNYGVYSNAGTNYFSANVGIGTTTPTTKLEVVGDASASGNITVGQNSALRSQYGPLNLAYKSGLNTWTTAMVLQDTTGNVGIGTTNPGAKLQLYGVATSDTPGSNSYLSWGGDNRYWNIRGATTGLEDLAIDRYYAGSYYEAMRIQRSTGNIGVGDTSPLALFTVGSGDLFQVDSTGRIVALDGVAHTIDDVSGNLTLTSNSNTISLNDNVTFAGTTTLNSLAYTWPGAQTTGYVLQTNGSGTLSWADPSVLTGGSNLWTSANGSLYPKNATLDLFVGGTATASAKFAFINANAGTPTASISGATNVNTFIDGNGNISTTNRTSLTLGNSATYNSTGNILLNPNGTGNVGIGTTAPSYKLDVVGDINLTGAIRANGGAGMPGFVLTSSGGGLNTWTDVTSLTGGTNLWTLANGSIYPINSTLDAFIGGTTTTSAKFAFINSNAGTPTASISGTTANVNTFIDGNGNISTTNRTSLTLGNSATYNSTGNILLNPNGTGNVGIGTTAPSYSLDVAGTFRATSTNNYQALVNTSGLQFQLASAIKAQFYTSGSNGILDMSDTGSNNTIRLNTNGVGWLNGGAIGIGTISPLATLDIRSNLGTIPVASISGNTSMAALIVDQSGTGDIFTASSSGMPRLVVRSNGNVGIGDTTPLSALTVGNGDLFQVDYAGRIVAIDGVAHTIDDLAGNLIITSASNLINLNSNITFAGTTTLNSLTYTWPGTQTNGFVLQTNGSGTLSWADPATLAGLWTLANGSVYTSNNTVDAFIGGNASSSAKFAFLNVNSGTPTASISGTTANVNTFIDGNGNIATTNRTTLTLGNSATYNSTGNILLNPNGTGNVGIGTTIPGVTLDISGTTNLSALRLTNTAVTSNPIFSINGPTSTNVSTGKAFAIFTSGESFARSQFYTDGKFGIGPGSSTRDIFLSRSATNTFSISSDGASGLGNLNVTGNVGISTTTPLATLDVRKNSGTTPVASVSGATSMSTLVVDQSGTGDILTASASGNPRFVVKNNGNVGVGIVNPTYKLDVNGTVRGDIFTDTVGGGTYYVDPSGDSVFGGGLSLVGGFTGASASISGSLTIGNTQMIKSEWGNLNFGYKDTMSTWATGMVLQDTTGNVGIGTVNPLAKLHLYQNTAANLTNLVENGNATYNSNLELKSSRDWLLQSLGTAGISSGAFGIYDNTATAYRMLIDSTGRMGIGTTLPLASLDLRSILGTVPVASISGNTSMAALIVDQSGSGDIFTASSSGETRFVVKSNGNVGIGVANPTGKLSIAGSSSTISNISGDITFNAASGNISFSNNNLINVSNIASIGQIQIGGFASPPTSIGNGAMYYDTTSNRVFYWDGSVWSEMGAKYWQRTLGSMAPQYITDAFNLGNTATGSALVHFPGTNNQNAWFYLGTGSVGIGTRTPSSTYALDVVGSLRADKYVDSASPAYYVDPAGSSVLGGNITNQGDIFLIDGTPEISSWDGANYNQITIRGSGDTTSASLCVDEGAGTACDGKINAGTIDPPYTINGKKYATYLPSMTGVKEETTGKVLVTEKNDEAKAYIKRIALGDQPEGSDLWLFGKTTNIKEQIKDMTILLSSNTNGKVWYTVDQNNLVLTLYSSTPSEISYRLTAPRFDAGKFANSRNEGDYGTGFILNDQGNVLAGAAPTYSAPKISVQAGIYSLIGNFIEEFTAANQALFANLTAGIINTQKIVSPIAEVETLTASKKIQSKEINSELIKASDSIETPRLNTNRIDIGTESGQLAKLVINGLHNIPVVTIDAEGSATFAGSLTAQAITSEQLTTDNASVSGTLIANEIKSQTIDTLSTQIASNSSTLASSVESLSGDINSVQQELAALKNTPLPNPAYYQNLDASYNSITVTDTASMFKAHIADSLVVGSIFVQNNSILALESNLTISSLSTITLFDGSVIIAKNGNITSKGQVSATSLAIKNTQGETVASIDASGSARFNEVIAKKFTLDSIATQGAVIADSGIMDETNTPIPAIKTNAEVAGTGTVPQDTKEVIIYNDNVTTDSLIYLTPTANNIQGQLSVTKKVTCTASSIAPCTPYFVISSSLAIHAETPFNWLIIN